MPFHWSQVTFPSIFLFLSRYASGVHSKVLGVELANGTFIRAKNVISNATPYHTFLELLPGFAQATGVKEQPQSAFGGSASKVLTSLN